MHVDFRQYMSAVLRGSVSLSEGADFSRLGAVQQRRGFSPWGIALKPEHVHNFGTYFVTSQCRGRRSLFQVDDLSRLFLRTVYTYAAHKRFLLHEFVVMPNHVHLIVTPNEVTLERAMQLIKGGFSKAVSDTGRNNLEVWQKGFSDHRIRDFNDYEKHRNYIWQNPVKAGLVVRAHDFNYSSANPCFKLDPIPQRLKPDAVGVG